MIYFQNFLLPSFSTFIINIAISQPIYLMWSGSNIFSNFVCAAFLIPTNNELPCGFVPLIFLLLIFWFCRGYKFIQELRVLLEPMCKVHIGTCPRKVRYLHSQTYILYKFNRLILLLNKLKISIKIVRWSNNLFKESIFNYSLCPKVFSTITP